MGVSVHGRPHKCKSLCKRVCTPCYSRSGESATMAAGAVHVCAVGVYAAPPPTNRGLVSRTPSEHGSYYCPSFCLTSIPRLFRLLV